MTGLDELSARMDRMESQLDRITALLEARTDRGTPLATATRAASVALTAVHDHADLVDQISTLLMQLGDPETLESLTRVATLAPKLEYAAHFVAAGPELMEEAMELARLRAQQRGLTHHEVTRRLAKAADALVSLTAQDQLDVAARLGRLMPAYAPLAEALAEALRRRTEHEGEEELKARMVDALLQLSDPDTQESLTRIANLAPQLEYAAHFAAAGPELLEEAMALANARVQASGLDSAMVKHRMTQAADLLFVLTQHEQLVTLRLLAASLPDVGPVVTAGAEVMRARVAVEGAESLERRLAEAMLELSDPETLASLTRIAALAPRLEYAAYFAAAGPELLEEAMDLVRAWGERNGVPGVDHRVQVGLEALIQLSTPETLRGLAEVSGIAASISHDPETVEALRKLTSRLPRVERTLTQVERSLGILESAARTTGLSGLDDLETPLTTGLRLLDRATNPGTLQALGTVIELAPKLAALARPLIDGLDGDDMPALARLVELMADPDTGRLVTMLHDKAPDLVRLLDLVSLQPGTVDLLQDLDRAASAASQEEPQPVGVLGLLGVLRDPQVQRTLGLGVSFSRHLDAQRRRSPQLEGK